MLKKGGVSCQDLIVKLKLNEIDLSITFCYLTPLQAGGFLKKKIKSLEKFKDDRKQKQTWKKLQGENSRHIAIQKEKIEGFAKGLQHIY